MKLKIEIEVASRYVNVNAPSNLLKSTQLTMDLKNKIDTSMEKEKFKKTLEVTCEDLT